MNRRFGHLVGGVMREGQVQVGPNGDAIYGHILVLFFFFF